MVVGQVVSAPTSYLLRNYSEIQTNLFNFFSCPLCLSLSLLRLTIGQKHDGLLVCMVGV